MGRCGVNTLQFLQSFSPNRLDRYRQPSARSESVLRLLNIELAEIHARWMAGSDPETWAKYECKRDELTALENTPPSCLPTDFTICGRDT